MLKKFENALRKSRAVTFLAISCWLLSAGCSTGGGALRTSDVPICNDLILMSAMSASSNCLTDPELLAVWQLCASLETFHAR